jgi:hypothetical protein
VTEAGFQRDVMKLAGSLGRLAHHCRDARLCEGCPGWPDTFIAGTSGLAVAELKLRGRGLSAYQVAWSYTLKAAGVPYYIWEPADLASGLVECHIKAST